MSSSCTRKLFFTQEITIYKNLGLDVEFVEEGGAPMYSRSFNAPLSVIFLVSDDLSLSLVQKCFLLLLPLQLIHPLLVRESFALSLFK